MLTEKTFFSRLHLIFSSKITVVTGFQDPITNITAESGIVTKSSLLTIWNRGSSVSSLGELVTGIAIAIVADCW